MNTTSILWVIALIAGILINVFIGKLAILIFKKDGTASRIPLRFIGIVLIINAVAYLLNFKL